MNFFQIFWKYLSFCKNLSVSGIAIVCQTLSSLEVGKLGVVKFGKESEIVQHLQVFIYLFIFHVKSLLDVEFQA